VVLVPGLLALVFGWLAFRSRVTGVYLSILTQAMTLALSLYLFQNDTGLRGNNGLSGLQNIPGDRGDRRIGCRSGSSGPRRWRSGSAMSGGLARVGQVRQHRARHPRRRVARALPRLPGGGLQAGGLHADRDDRGIAGALYYPQAGIINPGEIAPSPRSTWRSGSPSAGAGGSTAR
jgi:urea transport system permease protein